MLSTAVLNIPPVGVQSTTFSTLLQSWGMFGSSRTPTLSLVLNFSLTLVMGGYLVAAAPWYVDDVVDELVDHPAECFGWGIAVAIGVFVSIVFLFLTLFGFPIGIIVALFWGVFTALGIALTTIALVGLVYDSKWLGVVLGAVLTGVASTIFIANVLVTVFVALPGVGALLKDYYD